jgi:hypothetical protein
MVRGEKEMRRAVIAGGVILVGLVVMGGCTVGNVVRGSGKVITQDQNVSGFNAVTLSGIGTLVISTGDKEALTIEGEDNIVPLIKREVRDNRLTIGLTEGNKSISTTKSLRFDLTVKNLNDVTLAGSGDVQGAVPHADQLKLVVSGSGSISLETVDTNNLNVTVSGSGDIKAAGKSPSQSISISGSGNYEAKSLESKQAQVQVGGSGSATVKVSDKLDATVNGSGSVNYIGSPQVNQQINGSGDVRQVEGGDQ